MEDQNISIPESLETEQIDNENHDQSADQVDNQETPKDEATDKEIDYRKRYIDTQAAYTRERQKALTLEKELEAELNKRQIELDYTLDEQRERDDDFIELSREEYEKKWLQKDNERRQKAIEKHETELSERMKNVRQVSEAEVEASEWIQARGEIASKYADFNEILNPQTVLQVGDQVFFADIPPKVSNAWLKECEEGKITKQQFFDRVYSAIKSPKVAESPKATEFINMSKGAGGAKPFTGSEQPPQDASFYGENDIF